jgi:hypothetical protein
MEKEQLKNLTLEEAESELGTRIYEAALFIEELELAGKVWGNGHHAAQNIVQVALEELHSRWIIR